MASPMHAFSSLLSSIGSEAFDQQYFQFGRELFGADQCTIFRLQDDQPPQCLLAEAQQRKRRSLIRDLAQEYSAGAYTRDPNLSSTHDQPPIQVRCVTAANVSDPNYRRRFYEPLDAAQELTLISRTPGQQLYCSFVRSKERGYQAYSAGESEVLWQISPLLNEILYKHLSLMGPRLAAQHEAHSAGVMSRERRDFIFQQIQQALLQGPGKLTAREAEICALIGVGYTSLAISLHLGVSINTVGTHRKRAYAKLKINSQSELFSRYIDSARLGTDH